MNEHGKRQTLKQAHVYAGTTFSIIHPAPPSPATVADHKSVQPAHCKNYSNCKTHDQQAPEWSAIWSRALNMKKKKLGKRNNNKK